MPKTKSPRFTLDLVASLKSARCDDTGAWVISFNVPQSDGVKAAQLTAFTSEVMTLRVSVP